MHSQRFVQELNRLLRTEVPGLAPADKARLLARQADAYLTHESLRDASVTFVPFVAGRRPIDEAKHPGLGSSEASGLISDVLADELVLLYRLMIGGRPAAALPDGGTLEATLHWLDRDGEPREVLPGWPRQLDAKRMSDDPAAAYTLTLDVHDTFLPLASRDGGASRPFGFGAMFFERFRLDLALQVDGTTLASDAYTFEVYDDRGFGSLYQRIAELILPKDMAEQARQSRVAGDVSTSFHPWFPVLCIGVEKANLYMKAVRGDIAAQTRRLSDPTWLLRVGLYLELLTCIGIAEVAKGLVDILAPDERVIFETSPEWADIRRHLDVHAWQKVWALRGVGFATTLSLGQTPIGFTNLLKKRSATLAFLHAHHEDLKHAIELAGPNLVNAQETWQRVFRDAERAVLTMNEQAFPELGYLAEPVKQVVLWHRQGALAGLKLIPSVFSGPFGDQDGLFGSACRQYRQSMNYVARWAADRGLMEYTGAECVPTAVSLLESHVAGEHRRLERLQKRDGYEGLLAAKERVAEAFTVPLEVIQAALSRVRVFAALTSDELAELAKAARPIELGPHERILVQGNKGSSLFIVHEGELEVISKTDGKEKLVAQLGRGAIVGELAFLTGQPRNATVRAADAAVVIEVGAAHLRPLVEQRPAILDALGALMERRLSDVGEPASKPTLLASMWSVLFGG